MENHCKPIKITSFYYSFFFILLVQRALSQRTFTVAKNGKGNFSTIKDAIAATPAYSKDRTYIMISAGVYYENIIIGIEKTYITLIGQGMENTIISGARSTNNGFLTNDTATVYVAATGLVARDITFQNTAGPNRNQSVALTLDGGNTAFYRCRISSHQDILYGKSGVHFFRDCQVLGTIDFIFGSSKTMLQNCKIYVRNPQPGRSNTITAQGKNYPNDQTGIVLQNCTITAVPDDPPGPYVKTYLGRAWRQYSATVIRKSFLDRLIDPKGWLDWEGQTYGTTFCAEYNNWGPGSNTARRVKWVRMLTSMEASWWTVAKFINNGSWIATTGVPYY